MLARSLAVFSILCTQVSASNAGKAYEVGHVTGADDTPALLSGIVNYTRDATIIFKKGVTYNIFTPIKFPVLSNVVIKIEGNLTYPTNITDIQAAVNSSSYPGAWLAFEGGSNVTLSGSTDPLWGWIDGHGQQWWDEGNQVSRPHGIAFSKISGGNIKDLKIWKPIAWNFATSGSNNVHIHNVQILARSDNSSAFPFNTDGFSAGGTNLLFENNYVANGDDCLTVGSGASNITFRNTYCEGGHGLSIGSLGEGGAVANVQNVWIENCSMNTTLYGARFKSWTGGNGFARNVTWKNIEFNNVRFPIYVTQNYWDQEDGPAPPEAANNTHIEDFLFQDFFGTIDDRPDYFEGSCVTDPCWYSVANATGREVIIFDLHANTTTNVVAKEIFARTGSGAPVAVMCSPDTISNDVGFVCQDGLFVPTAAGR